MIVELILGYITLNSIINGFGEIAIEQEQREKEKLDRIRKIQERLEYYGMQ